MGEGESIMEYEIKDGKFDVSFRYPDEVDVEVIDDERRQTALRAHFGDKPAVYPLSAADPRPRSN